MNNDVCIFVGRFQPLTLGHIKCCEQIYKQRKLKCVLLIIETTKADDRHPFLTSELMNAYEKIVKRYPCIADIILVKNADIVVNTELCREHGYEPVAWVCGEDRIKPYQDMATKYAEKANLSPLFEVFCVDRSDGISATQCREYLKQGDQRNFEKYTPKEVGDMYFKLRKLLEQVK